MSKYVTLGPDVLCRSPRGGQTDGRNKTVGMEFLQGVGMGKVKEKGKGMLVLSRQRDETIMVGDEIIITVIDIRGDKVRLGIKAPEIIPVHRKEVYDAIQREQRRLNVSELSSADKDRIKAELKAQASKNHPEDGVSSAAPESESSPARVLAFLDFSIDEAIFFAQELLATKIIANVESAAKLMPILIEHLKKREALSKK